MAISPLELETNSSDEDGREQQNSSSGSCVSNASDGDGGDNSSSGKSSSTPLHRRRRLRTYSYEVEDEEFEEALGLLDHPIADHTDFEEETPQGRTNSARAWIWWMLTMVVVAIFSRVLHHKESRWEEIHGDDERLPPRYECPVKVKDDESPSSHETTDNGIFLPALETVDNATSSTTTTTLPEYSHDQLKENLRDWTAEQIAPYLLHVDTDDEVLNRVSILESSSHTMGLNLFLTLELLEEMQAGDSNEKSTQIWVYGNDRNPFGSSFSFFHQDEQLQKLPNMHLGILCADEEAPLTDLSYIPVDSFDMVYTGHLPPLNDPLEFQLTFNELAAKYQAICTSGEEDWQGNLLKDLAQQNQEKWFATWVGDMARVLRPGGLIVIENLGGPYCEEDNKTGAGGGVTKKWWSSIVKDRAEEWEIDPKSLKLGDDQLRESRYRVVMRRRDREGEDAEDSD